MRDANKRVITIMILLAGLVLGACQSGAVTSIEPLALDQEKLGALLIEAVKANDVLEVKRLLETGANANVVTPADGPVLMLAASKGNSDVVMLLAEYGADINCQGLRGDTPLTIATDIGNMAVVDLLLNMGVDINSRDSTHGQRSALDIAANHDQLEVAKLLLTRGADASLANPRGVPPLHFAAGKNHSNMVRLLIANGASNVRRAGRPCTKRPG